MFTGGFKKYFLPGIPWLAEFFSHLVTHKHGPEDSFEFRLFIDLLNLFTVLTCFPEIILPCVSASRVSSSLSSWSARRRQSSVWRAGCGAGGSAPPPTPQPRGSTPPTPTRPGGGVTLSGCPMTISTFFLLYRTSVVQRDRDSTREVVPKDLLLEKETLEMCLVHVNSMAD